MTRPTVYIVNKGCHDYFLAEPFGEIIFLSEGSFSRFSTGKIFRAFEEKLKDSKPEDYILISGLSVMNSIACSIFARRHGRINLLLYNSGPNRKQGYVERTVVLDEEQVES